MLGQKAKPNAVAGYDEMAFRDYLVSAMRVGSLRLLLSKNELDAIGTALKGGLIGTAEALDWLADLGVMPWIDTVPGAPNEQ